MRTGDRTGRTTRRAAAVALAGALLVAACTSSSVLPEEVTDGSSPATTVADAVAGDPPSADPPPDPNGTDTGEFPTVATEAPDPSGLPDLDEADPLVVTGTLDNGLRYLVRENDNPGSRVEMRLAVDAGSGLQTAEQGGGAHFLEHMLFNGTEQFPENELIAVLRSFGAAFGADINAYTSYDETVYQLTMPTADPGVVSTGLDVLEQWLSAATIAPDQVVAERGVVLDEWRSRAQTSDGRVFDEIQRFFLDGSPYENRTPIGEDTEISSTEAGPLRAFYDDWYRPDNASVIVVGDIDAGDIVEQIEDRFAPAASRGGSPERPALIVEPATEPRARVVADPDLSQGFGFVTLPLTRVAAGDGGDDTEAALQQSILDGLAFDIIATRLANDATRGEAPFDDAYVDSSGFVRSFDAPEIGFSADGDDLEASVQVVLDEYERTRRFGFSQAEVDRAVEARRSTARVDYDGRFSRQDASFADEYVRHVLEGEAIPTATRWFDFVNEVLDRASPETIAHVFVDRLERAGAHIFVAAPDDEIADVPAADDFVAMAESIASRPLDRRADEATIGDSLMARPDPIEETDVAQLADGSVISFIAPTVLTFPNGVRVVLNVTPITEGGVVVEARSPGGTSTLADADVADADAAVRVVPESGVGSFDAVALDAFLSDKEVELRAAIDPYTEGLTGFAATSDLETMFQLIHLVMTAPRVDLVALEQFIDDERSFAEDPSIDAGYAGFKALLDARYDDPRYLLLDVDDLASIDAADVERVFRDRFGDASDWVFSLNGDFDSVEARDLARTYLATLPASGRVEPTDYVEPPPPPGVVEVTTRAGAGNQASVSFLFTAAGSSDRRDDVMARMVQQVVTARLTDTIREELGESYSPFAVLELTNGASPLAELYLSISTGPDLVDSVTGAVLDQLDDLRTDGPTDAEFAATAETIRNELDLFSNPQLNDEILRVLTDPAGHGSFDEFLRQSELVSTISRTDVRDAIGRWAPGDQYIQVQVLPR